MVKIAELAAAIDAKPTGRLDGQAASVAHSSKKCAPGDVFVAIKGMQADGNDYIPHAIRQGASAIVSESPCPFGFALPWLQVADARRALAQIAAAVYGRPSRELMLVGITGTNGKTTTAYLVDSILKAEYGKSAMLTTVCSRIGDREQQAERTTPEASDIQRFLRSAVDDGCKGAVMEVSSHAIDLHRADALEFASTVFTNLTQDHLDYHKTMESYFAVKQRLFDGSLGTANAKAAVNIDDSYGRRLAEIFAGELFSYGFSDEARVRAIDYKLTFKGLHLYAETPAGIIEIASPLVGRPHVYNILAASAAALSLGIGLDAVKHGVESLQCVPGRFDRVPCDEDFEVVVDYAHTDDALKNVLATAREVAEGRVICVFGCGGDRDRSKRPLMGEAAARLSDLVIVTSDNPRSEDPDRIIDEAEVGIKRVGAPYHKIADRREAINFAILQAKKGDLIVIAGKGHENYQILIDRTIRFDD